jgi:membrane-bound acyltransferase YfiQ involved in biofilm formation
VTKVTDRHFSFTVICAINKNDMKNFLIKYRFKIMFVALGAIAGLLYWHFIGCSSGTCPITSHWYTSGAYGMLFGWLISDLFKTNNKNPIKNENQ